MKAPESNTVPIETFVPAGIDFAIDERLPETAVESTDELITEVCCGEKYANSNVDTRYQRAGTTTRPCIATGGKREFMFHQVKDIAEDSSLRRACDHFHRQKHYTAEPRSR